VDGMIKAGLPARMREWMSGRPGTFGFNSMCTGLDIPQGPVRQYVRRTLEAFVDRGEVQREDRKTSTLTAALKLIMKGVEISKYRYNHSWRRPSDAPTKKKILRAMRLISFHDPFSVADVQGLAGTPERSYVDLLIRKLVKDNYLRRVGVRACPHGVGKESLYRVTDSTRFRVDLL
jgi:hypothetical protein